MRLTRIFVKGFKSFAQELVLPINPGLTAIVGPNGCGKSNLMEAIRWVMGESSAKRLRGKDMYDVVFAGSVKEGPKKICEVEVHFDPHVPEYTEKYAKTESCVIKRRLVVDEGSIYSINGKTCRARDVQIFFADLGAGSSSHAFVGQGQVTKLIEQSPQSRRHLLEEAAGLRGLQVRRDESLSKLRNAEQNLVMLTELMVRDEHQWQELKIQATQAEKYSELSKKIHATEAHKIFIAWRQAKKKIDSDRQKILNKDEEINQLEDNCARYNQNATTMRQTRQQLQEARDAWDHKIRLVELDITRTRTRLESTRQRTDEIKKQGQDLSRDLEQVSERLQKIVTWHSEHALKREHLIEPSQFDDLRNKLKEDISIARQSLEAAISRRKATAESYQEAILETKEQQGRADRIRDYIHAKERDIERLEDEMDRCLTMISSKQQSVAEREKELNNLSEQRSKLKNDQSALYEMQQKAQSSSQQALSTFQSTRAELQEQNSKLLHLKRGLSAEAEGYARAVDSFTSSRNIRSEEDSNLRYNPEFARVVALALGNDRDASSLDEGLTSPKDAGQHYWREMPSEDSYASHKSMSLWNQMTAPAYMKSRLDKILVFDQKAQAEDYQLKLQPGCAAISKDGWLYGWDGVVCHISKHSQRAMVIEAEVRLTEIEQQQASLDQEIAQHSQMMQARLAEAKQESQKLQQSNDQLRKRIQETSNGVQSLESRIKQHQDIIYRLNAEIESLNDRQAQREQQYQALKEEESKSQTELSQLNREMAAEGDDEIDNLKETLTNHEQVEQQANKSLKELEIEKLRFNEKEEGNRTKLAEWQERKTWLDQEHKDLLHREVELHQRQQEHKTRWMNVTSSDADQGQLQVNEAKLAEMTQERDKIAEQARHCESGIEDNAEKEVANQQQLKSEVAIAATLKESVRNAHNRVENLVKDLRERTGQSTDEYEKTMPDNLSKSYDTLSKLFQSLTIERDSLGSVNLLAMEESDKIEKQLGETRENVNDLEKAIDTLRKGIAKIDLEANKSMTFTLQKLEKEYVAIYQRLFRGGEARLELKIEDSLWDAGLEIFAAPPGKRLRSLSLLSGGEQTLTALSLLLAVHRLSKVPFCILDEVDAALDDQNTELLAQFLVDLFSDSGHHCCLLVTHNRLSMSAANRLVGVTMPRPGTSQVVGVSLEMAHSFIDA